MTVNVVYAVVFGPLWNQINYLTDYNKARSALVGHTCTLYHDDPNDTFKPFMYELVHNSKDGVMAFHNTYDVHPAYLGQLHKVVGSNAFDFIRLV